MSTHLPFEAGRGEPTQPKAAGLCPVLSPVRWPPETESPCLLRRCVATDGGTQILYRRAGACSRTTIHRPRHPTPLLALWLFSRMPLAFSQNLTHLRA